MVSKRFKFWVVLISVTTMSSMAFQLGCSRSEPEAVPAPSTENPASASHEAPSTQTASASPESTPTPTDSDENLGLDAELTAEQIAALAPTDYRSMLHGSQTILNRLTVHQISTPTSCPINGGVLRVIYHEGEEAQTLTNIPQDVCVHIRTMNSRTQLSSAGGARRVTALLFRGTPSTNNVVSVETTSGIDTQFIYHGRPNLVLAPVRILGVDCAGAAPTVRYHYTDDADSGPMNDAISPSVCATLQTMIAAQGNMTQTQLYMASVSAGRPEIVIGFNFLRNRRTVVENF